MNQPRILVIDGNRAATREAQVAAGGLPTGEGYAQVLRHLAPLSCDIVRPADGEVRLTGGAGLADYDGAVMTGSALNIYDGGAHIERQVDLARAVFASAVPFFGSCWGLQVAVTAAGGRVRRNPLGREFGFARRIELSASGIQHPMFSGKPRVFEAVTVHSDDVEQLPAAALVLASNEMGVQALELRSGTGSIWAVQYHPEYSFAEIAATTQRYADALLGEELFGNRAELDQFVAELRLLMQDPQDRRLAWKHGLGPAMQDERLKLAELRNWLELKVMPRYQRRH
ncbi:MAG TPA: type 1 glutamine amidotransferase [Steroidobacteraceae bacterium]|jgi:GMP synthase (glutamine-hydrolysing)|nr:type 1 glutamine amidotransferase [Steroidobacteraceae bacterium]